jgi:hypothetical protein
MNEKEAPKGVGTVFKWVARILGVLMVLPALEGIILLAIFAVYAAKEHVTFKTSLISPVFTGTVVGWLLMSLLGLALVRMGWRKENRSSTPLPGWLTWICWIGGTLFIGMHAVLLYFISFPVAKAGAQVIREKAPKDAAELLFMVVLTHAWLVGNLVGFLLGLVIVRWPGMRLRRIEAQSNVSLEPVAVAIAEPVRTPAAAAKNRRWAACNILHLAPDAKRLWQFDAKGKGFVPAREHRVPHSETLPANVVAKSWSSLWQPKLNVAWLPTESVFLRVVELPAANLEETTSMVELQLEKLSPIPVTQVVWTMHVLGTHQGAAKADGTVESLQSVIVIIASRAVVEEFLGRLERDGFLADRLEVPMLDQLEAVQPKGDSVWLFPLTLAGQNAALVGWWFGGAWRSLSFVTLPPAGDRAAELKSQLGLLAMAGEVEGWLSERHEWNLVADPVNASEWEQLLRTGLNEPVHLTTPPTPVELAARSATRTATTEARVRLQPAEFSERYREQFQDRLWLHALGYAGVIYAIVLVIYFSLATWTSYQAGSVEHQVAAISGSYTNAVQLRARLAVLQERSELKFAALNCWKLVAEELPASVSLQRSSFLNGGRLMLSGQVDPADIQKLSDFYEHLRKARIEDKPYFNTDGGDPLSYVQHGNMVSWNFTLELSHVEAEVR